MILEGEKKVTKRSAGKGKIREKRRVEIGKKRRPDGGQKKRRTGERTRNR